MKPFLILLFTFGTRLACAQPEGNYFKKTGRKLDASTVVRDSSGMVYPYAIWTALLSKGYIIKAIDPKNEASEMLLVKLSEEEQEKRLSKMPPPRESLYFKTGEEFRPFKVKDMKFETINLKEAKGKIVVLNFWFINCPPCRQEMPDLNAMVDAFAGNDKVLFVSIALDSRSQLEDFLKQSPFKYKVIDDGRFLADKYGIKSYPTHVIIDPEGKVAFHTSGLATQTVYWLKKSINELLAKQAVVAN